MKSILSLSLYFFLINLSFSQNRADSLQNALSTSDNIDDKISTLSLLADEFQNPNDKIRFARQAFKLSEDASNKGKIIASNEMGVCHGMLGQIDSSQFFFTKALEASIASGDSAYISSAYNGLGNLARISGDLNASLENFLKALDYSDAVKNKKWYADILTNVSGVYFESKNYQEALKKVFEAMEIYEELDDQDNISYAANLLAIVYQALGEYDKAYLYNQEALKLLLVSKDTIQIIYNYVNTTEILIQQNLLDKAAENALKAIGLANEFGERDPHISSLLTLASIYYRQGKVEAADRYTELGIEIAKKYKFNAQLPNAYVMKSLIESARGNYLNSYDWMELRQAASDSIRSLEVAAKISELDVQYETAKKENEIQRLNTEQEIKDLELQQAQTRNLFLSILAAIFIVIGGIAFYFYYKLKKTNQQLEAVNSTKDQLFSMIAHDIKNPLSAFKAIAQALEENYKSMPEEEIHLFISQLDSSSSKLLDLLQNLLEWSITESGNLRFNPEKVEIKYIVDETIELFQGAIAAKQLKVENRVPEELKVWADYKMLFSVCRNLISNAVKFTNVGGSVFIDIQPNGQLVEVSVKDTGAGMTEDQLEKLFDKNAITDKHGTGLGLVICKEFVEQNGGSISVDSHVETGTTFKFTLSRASK